MPSRLDLLGVLDHVAQSLCERLEFDSDTSSQVTMSVIEAGTNAIQHGHRRDPSKVVDATFELFADRLEITVRDSGPGFDLGAIGGDVTSPEHCSIRGDAASSSTRVHGLRWTSSSDRPARAAIW
jgi:serine/threonine-protein kinase RsbW